MEPIKNNKYDDRIVALREHGKIVGAIIPVLWETQRRVHSGRNVWTDYVYVGKAAGKPVAEYDINIGGADHSQRREIERDQTLLGGCGGIVYAPSPLYGDWSALTGKKAAEVVDQYRAELESHVEHSRASWAKGAGTLLRIGV